MILRITDGTAANTADLIWHSIANRDFILAKDGWAPSVTARKRGALGGNGPYIDVVEEIEVHVCGDSQVETLANLGLLSRLLEQAERWWDGEPVSPVLIQYTPNGSTQLLQAVIKGRAPGDETSGVNLPTTFNSTLNAFMIESLKLRFVRRGQWVGIPESATSSGVTSPAIMTATFAADHPTLSPLKIEIGGFTRASVGSVGPGIVLIANDANRLALIEAETMSKITGGATVGTSVDFGKSPSNGNTLQITPVGPAPSSALVRVAVPSGFAALAKTVIVVVAYRNTSTTVSYLVRPVLDDGYPIYGEYQVFPASATGYPVITPFEPIRLSKHVQTIALDIQAQAIGGTLLIDYIALLAAEDEANVSFGLTDAALALTSGAFASGATPIALTINPRILTDPNAVAEYAAATTSEAQAAGYAGDPFLNHRGTAVSCLFLATNLDSWRYSGITNTLTATRQRAFLVPQ